MVLYMDIWWCIGVYGEEKRNMVMYRGAWYYYTWLLTRVYGDVLGCMVLYMDVW